MRIFVIMINNTAELEQRDAMIARFRNVELDLERRIDLIGLEYSNLINKELFENNLSAYCKRFIQAGTNSISVRFMIPSQYGLPSIVKEKMEELFNKTFPGNSFK
jgi:hypothetical protein